MLTRTTSETYLSLRKVNTWDLIQVGLVDFMHLGRLNQLNNTIKERNGISSRKSVYDLKPGKVKLDEREFEKLVLQGMFDYPHNKVNDQLIDNIDIKEADKKYYEKFKAFKKKLSHSEPQNLDGSKSNFNRYKRESPPMSLQRNYQSSMGQRSMQDLHQRHFNGLDQLQEDNEYQNQKVETEPNEDDQERPYEDPTPTFNESQAVPQQAQQSPQRNGTSATNSRNAYQNLQKPIHVKASNVSY